MTSGERDAVNGVVFLVQQFDMNRYAELTQPKLICDGKGPYACQEYTGAPCDC